MNKEELDELIPRLCAVFKKTTGHSRGHIHFRYKGKRDHLVLVIHSESLIRIVTKNEQCKKGKCLSWRKSEFSDFSPQEAFLRFFDQIDTITIDEPGFKRTWDSLDDLLNWLNKTLEKTKAL